MDERRPCLTRAFQAAGRDPAFTGRGSASGWEPAGMIAVTPAAFGAAWRACTHCEFRPFCRFEEGVAGMRFRRLSADEGVQARGPSESLESTGPLAAPMPSTRQG